MCNFVQCVVLILVVFFCVQITAQEAGEPCRTSKGQPGICKFLTSCASAMREISRGHFPEDNCNSSGYQTVTCCKTPKTSPRNPNRKRNKKRPNQPKKTTSTTTELPTKTPNPRQNKKRTIPQRVAPGSRVVGETAAKMCKTYAKYAYEERDDVGLSLFSGGVQKDLVCPSEKEELIFGGKNATEGEFPHMAHIGYITNSETTWACGGSIISEKFVLTVSHCMVQVEYGPPKLVRAGFTSITNLKGAQTRPVKKIHLHPEYLALKYNDIGLIELASPFDLNTLVRPACLYTQKTFPVRNAIASGWGRVAWTGDNSKSLLKVVLELFSNSKCNEAYRKDMLEIGSTLPQGIVEDLMVCAGSSRELKDACHGDSGGPLQIYHEDTPDIKCMYDIIGVTIFGKACGLSNKYPGVYTRVSAYTKWIEDIVWPQ